MAPDRKPPVLSGAPAPTGRPRRVGKGQPPPPAAAAAGPTGSLSRAVCAPHEFQCSNRTCLAAVFVCDGDDDCGDGSDERGCADPACGPREFRCSGGSGACIPERWVCDRQFDCEDRSDEAAELCGRAGPGATAAPRRLRRGRPVRLPQRRMRAPGLALRRRPRLQGQVGRGRLP